MSANGCVSSTANDVKDHYRKRVNKGADVNSSSCSLAHKILPHVKEALSLVHDDVTSRYYGCGLIIPECLEGMRMLDLGCGAGQDCYTLSKLVGEDGHVTGVDMTPEQLNIAKKYVDYHTEKFGYKSPNVDFVEGYIEDLEGAGVAQNSYDVIVSNCVINLTADKRAAFKAAYDALKVGGEMYFSDMYIDRVLPDEVTKQSKTLWGEGLTGALYWPNLYSITGDIGFAPPRLFQARRYRVNGQDSVHDYNLNGAQYVAVTYRLFKLAEAKTLKQPDTVTVTYNGGITGNGCKLVFDHKNTFHTNEPCLIDASLAAILRQSRLGRYFTFTSYDEGAINPYEVADKLQNPINVTYSETITDEDGEEFFTSTCAAKKARTA